MHAVLKLAKRTERLILDGCLRPFPWDALYMNPTAIKSVPLLSAFLSSSDASPL
jgi:hypothetical protein